VGAVEYLAAAAGLQQWKQAALAYALMAGAGRPMAEAELCKRAEALLAAQFGLQARPLDSRPPSRPPGRGHIADWSPLGACRLG
jgi:hypothetical protein